MLKCHDTDLRTLGMSINDVKHILMFHPSIWTSFLIVVTKPLTPCFSLFNNDYRSSINEKYVKDFVTTVNKSY